MQRLIPLSLTIYCNKSHIIRSKRIYSECEAINLSSLVKLGYITWIYMPEHITTLAVEVKKKMR